eukprot:6178356-Pleurochrysis_carterae.AAC.1
MAPYRKRKFSGSTPFRPRARPRFASSVRRMVAKKRYRRRFRRTRSRKLTVPRSVISYSRLPPSCTASFVTTYVINATLFKNYYIRANYPDWCRPYWM